MFPNLTPGASISVAELKRLADLAQRNSASSASGGVGSISGAGGSGSVPQIQDLYTAIITARSGARPNVVYTLREIHTVPGTLSNAAAGRATYRTSGRDILDSTITAARSIDVESIYEAGDLVLVRRNIGDVNEVEILARLGRWDDDTPASGCNGCGWLLDFPITKALKLTIPSAVGRCACVDTGQGGDDYILVHDGTKWVLWRNIETCCSCGTLELTLTVTTNNPLDEIPELKLKINKGCVSEVPFEYIARLKCCPTKKSAVFVAAGPENCDGNVECDNEFELKIECVDCELFNKGCEDCQENLLPPILYINASGFSGAAAKYNGEWYLSSTGSLCACGWSVVCETQTVTITAAVSGQKITINFGSDATYEYDTGDPDIKPECFKTHTYTRTAGSAGTTPASITATPQYCEKKNEDGGECCEDVRTEWPETIYAIIDEVSGDCADCIPWPIGVPLTLTKLAGSWTPQQGWATEYYDQKCETQIGSSTRLLVQCDNLYTGCRGFRVNSDCGLSANLVDRCRCKPLFGEAVIEFTEPGNPGIPAANCCHPSKTISMRVRVSETGSWYWCVSDGEVTPKYSCIESDTQPPNYVSGPHSSAAECANACQCATPAGGTFGGASLGMMASSDPGTPTMAIAARISLQTRPPCMYEGAVVESCKTCGGGKKEDRDVRDCSHPDNPTETCTRNHPRSAVWRCADCPHYTAVAATPA